MIHFPCNQRKNPHPSHRRVVGYFENKTHMKTKSGLIYCDNCTALAGQSFDSDLLTALKLCLGSLEALGADNATVRIAKDAISKAEGSAQ